MRLLHRSYGVLGGGSHAAGVLKLLGVCLSLSWECDMLSVVQLWHAWGWGNAEMVTVQ